MEPYKTSNGKEIQSQYYDLVHPYINFEGDCTYARGGFHLKDLPHDIKQLNNFKVSDIEGFISHMRCIRPKTLYNREEIFYYLGKFNRYYYAQKKFRFHNVGLWLHKIDSKYSVNALAGFSPCSDETPFANVWLYPNPTNPSQTIMQSIRFGNIKFHPTWPHHYYSDHGEWHGSTIYKYMDKHMKLSNRKHWKQSFEQDQFDGTVTDTGTTMQYNKTSKVIPVSTEFDIHTKYWQGSLTVEKNAGKDFNMDFLPYQLPFVGITLKNGFHKQFVDSLEKTDVSFSSGLHFI